MSRHLLVLAVAAVVVAAACSHPVRSPNGTDSRRRADAHGAIRVLVVTGGPTLYHAVQLVPTSFYTLFEGWPDVEWVHATSDEAAFADDIRDSVDVVVFYNRSDTLSDSARVHLRAFAESGRGIVALHHALGSYNGWPWWGDTLIGARYWMKASSDHAESGFAGDQALRVVVSGSHPVTTNLNGVEFLDEAYSRLTLSPDNRVLARTDNALSAGPLIWVSGYVRARVMVIQPGHGPAVHRDPNYRALIHRAIQWSAGRS